MKTSTNQIKKRLDEILSEYLSVDAQIVAGIHNNSEFFGSLDYYVLNSKKDDLLRAYHKLTDALTAIEQYM